MKCPLTGNDEWENVDEFRFKSQGMMINKKSGFISYPDRLKDEEELKAYYRKDYRKPPQITNLFTGQRKLNYHQAFLEDLFNEWKEKSYTPVVGELGGAYGLFLNWIRTHFPEADINGTEWTLSYKRVAWHEFGIKMEDELPTDKKYDLIASYKVAEHQQDIYEKFKLYRSMLKDEGYFYVSVPIWFKKLNNFGAGGTFDIEYYYHPDHINVWTEEYFENLLWKSGFDVIKFDDKMYDNTYLCKKCDDTELEKRQRAVEFDNLPSVEQIKKHLKIIHQIAICIEEQTVEKAVELWPNFPYAYQYIYERNRVEWNKNGYDEIKNKIIEPALKNTGDDALILSLGADIATRYEKFEDALIYLDRMNRVRPNNESCLLMASNVYRQLAERSKTDDERKEFYQKSLEAVRHLRRTSLQKQNDAINWIYFDESRIPMPHE